MNKNGRNVIFTTFVISILTWLSLSCKTAQNPFGGSDIKFSIMDPASSILPAMSRAGGTSVSVCLRLIGFDDAAEAARVEMWARESIPWAVNNWNRLLFSDTDWPIQEDMQVQIDTKQGHCSDSTAIFNVNIWANEGRFRLEGCPSSPPEFCCASTDIRRRTIKIGPINRGKPESLTDSFTLLHEYGHLLGLGDTYRIPGYLEWMGGDQPDSVMNGRSKTLTDDDKLALWATVHAIKTGKRSCDKFGTDVRLRSNYWNSIMCDPRAQPINTDAVVGSTESESMPETKK